jgi:hypothetical protein
MKYLIERVRMLEYADDSVPIDPICDPGDYPNHNIVDAMVWPDPPTNFMPT